MKDYAKGFYNSPAWKDCRRSYKESVGGLCERCKAKGLIVAGRIVHHKIHIEPETINMPEVTLNFNNLELVCMDCHREYHDKDIREGKGLNGRRRWRVSDDGSVSPL